MRGALLLAISLALLPLTHAAEPCGMTTSKADVDTGPTPAGQFYYVEDCGITKPCMLLFSFWVYQESNNIPGLQRGDPVHDDTCQEFAGPSDTILL